MWIYRAARGFRAAVAACVLLAQAVEVAAGPAAMAGTFDRSTLSIEPFGLLVSPLAEGELTRKWRGVERELADEWLVLSLCQEDRARCLSAPARQFLAIVDEAQARDGRARLGEINRSVNLGIRSMSDELQYGEIDVWRSPLALFAAGAGDCEDYAIAKFVALHAAGVESEDLRIVIMRDTVRHEDHAVAAARLQGRWLLLDNRRMAMIEDSQVRNYRPLFVIDHNGIRQYIDSPQLAAGSGAAPVLAGAQTAAAQSGIFPGQSDGSF